MEASAIIRDIVAGAMIFGIEIPVELTMMLRAIMTIEGVGKEIQPDLDVLEVAKPILVKIVWQRYHPLKMGNELLRGAGRFGALARDLPFHLQDIIEDIRQGRLRIVAQDPARTRALDRLGKQIRAAIVSSSLLGAGVALMITDHSRFGLGLLIGSGVWMIFHLFFDGRTKK
jgi:ubiquinone biosynthesis protein